MKDKTLLLVVKRGRLQTLCDELADKSRNPAHLLASLSTLQTFIASMVEPAEEAGEAYVEVRAILDGALEQARERVLQQQGRQLQDALMAEDVAAVSRVHRALSRNGFQQAAQCALAQASMVELSSWAQWVSEWCAQAQASAASPYPDAMDFEKAGLSMVEYLAMQDVRIFFVSQGHLSAA